MTTKKKTAKKGTQSYSLYIRLDVDDHVRLCQLANISGPKVQRAQPLCLKISRSVHKKLGKLVVRKTIERARPVTKQEVVIALIHKAKESTFRDASERLTKQSVVVSLIEAA